MSLAVYTRQLYAVIFLYLVFLYYRKLNFKVFFLACLIIFLFAIPGILLVFNFPSIISTSLNNSYYNSILINSSIISFYLVPIYFFLFFNKDININLKDKKIIIVSILLLISVVIFAQNFDYNFRMGGGFFLKLSYILFNNFYLFFLTSFAGLFFLYLVLLEDKNSFFLTILLLFVFTSSAIFQKYFEPMFLLIFFLMLETKASYKFFANYKYTYIYYSYILLYFASSIINDIFQITKNI